MIATVAGGRWVGLAVFVVLHGGGPRWWWLRTPADERPAQTAAAASRGGRAPHPRDRERDGRRPHPTLDDPREEPRRPRGGARRHAGAQLAAEALGLGRGRRARSGAGTARREPRQARGRRRQARGEVGDGDPLQAMEDALRTFGADEIIISTHPEGRSNWLERGVVERARERFAVPITHVVVDLERERQVSGSEPQAREQAALTVEKTGSAGLSGSEPQV